MARHAKMALIGSLWLALAQLFVGALALDFRSREWNDQWHYSWIQRQGGDAYVRADWVLTSGGGKVQLARTTYWGPRGYRVWRERLAGPDGTTSFGHTRSGGRPAFTIYAPGAAWGVAGASWERGSGRLFGEPWQGWIARLPLKLVWVPPAAIALGYFARRLWLRERRRRRQGFPITPPQPVISISGSDCA